MRKSRPISWKWKMGSCNAHEIFPQYLACFQEQQILMGFLVILSMVLLSCTQSKEKEPVYSLYVKAFNPLKTSYEIDCIWQEYELIENTITHSAVLDEPPVDENWTPNSLDQLYWKFDSLEAGVYRLRLSTVFTDKIDTLVNIQEDIHVDVTNKQSSFFEQVPEEEYFLEALEEGDTLEIVVSDSQCDSQQKDKFLISYQDSVYYLMGQIDYDSSTVSFSFKRYSNQYIKLWRLERIAVIWKSDHICPHAMSRSFSYKLANKVKVVRPSHCKGDAWVEDMISVLYGK